MAISTVKVEDLNRAMGCDLPLRLDTSRWNSGLALLRQAPGFPPVRLEEPIAGRRQGKRRGRGAGNTVPRPLTPARYRLRSRVKGGNLGTGCMPSLGLTGQGRHKRGRSRQHVQAACEEILKG